jgi:hypothetical protein
LSFFAWLEHSSLAMWIGLSGSFFAYPFILLIHTIGLTLIVGVNLVVALRVLGVSPEIPLSELRKLFAFTWIGLAMNASTGVLLLIAKATQFIVNPAFYFKMASIGLALSIFFVIRARLFRDPLVDDKHLETSSKVLALALISFWLLAIVGGRAMAYVGEAAQFSRL